MAAYPADAGKDLPGHQEGIKQVYRAAEEVVVGSDQVVLVATEGVAAEVIDGVGRGFDKLDERLAELRVSAGDCAAKVAAQSL